ncbi:hypothetical protein N44_01084 [Microcystis aeruginosa NIES-44]|jgi:hypothetical protein|uniref:Uncharacterized protein n=1 Tax=Microcystis aeruginosa NIES-44 TaxID=449439 RepID=A0A0A1VTA6_MICAE|nr:hypothetical protein N44_01084 [Microcystis aeruginosa NIES-44]
MRELFLSPAICPNVGLNPLTPMGAALLERRMASQTSIAVCLEVVEQQA